MNLSARGKRVCGECKYWEGEEGKPKYRSKDKGECICSIPEWMLEVDHNACIISYLSFNCKCAQECECFEPKEQK